MGSCLYLIFLCKSTHCFTFHTVPVVKWPHPKWSLNLFLLDCRFQIFWFQNRTHLLAVCTQLDILKCNLMEKNRLNSLFRLCVIKNKEERIVACFLLSDHEHQPHIVLSHWVANINFQFKTLQNASPVNWLKCYFYRIVMHVTFVISFLEKVRLLPHSVCSSFGSFGTTHSVSQPGASPTFALTVLLGHNMQPARALPW